MYQFSRKPVRSGCVYIEKEIYDMELDHVIMEAGKSKICSLGQQAGDPVEFHSEFKDSVQ